MYTSCLLTSLNRSVFRTKSPRIIPFLCLRTTATTSCKMAEEREANLEKFKEQNHTAFVVGYTGETGKEVVKELAKTKAFKKVYLLGRRTIDLGPDLGPEFEQRTIDFEDVSKSASLFAEADVGFCTLGTTRGKAGKDGFIKVDKDYCLDTAKVAKDNGCKHFVYCSSNGANKNSWLLYPKVKGEVEEELKGMGFERLSIFRPAVLLCDRQERRTGEKFFKVLLKPITVLCPTVISIPTSVVGRGMLNDVILPEGPKVITYENRDIHCLSGNVKK